MVYDLRTNMPRFGKTNQLKPEHFKEFEESFRSDARVKEKIERWSCFTIEAIKTKDYNLDLGLVKDESVIDHDQLPDPIGSSEDAIAKLEQAVDLLQSVIKELRICGVDE